MKSLFLFCLFWAITSGIKVQAQSYEVVKHDTINILDRNNFKTGWWVIRGKNKPKTCYHMDQKIEEGNYVNNRKDGVWIEYYCNSNMRSKLTYINGVLNGYAVFYDEKGHVLKEGAFKNNKWVKP